MTDEFGYILQDFSDNNVNDVSTGSATIQGFIDGLRPIERISVTEWADKYRVLSSISSAEYGKYRTDRVPYMKKVMDCLTVSSPYKKIVIMKGAQTGFTEIGCNFIGYCMHIAPAPILMVQPTDAMVELVSKTRIDPLVSACPELALRVAQPKSRDGKNTINMKAFPGGILKLTGANSGVGLRSQAIRYLILDEIDAYPHDVDKEGSPIDLAIVRTRTFSNNCKILLISTPTIAGMSAIEREFIGKPDENGKLVGGTDQNYYHVPCPHCGEKQRLIFEQLKWDEGKPETVKYCCVHCGVLFDERHKTEMLAAGEWIPSVPEKSNDDVIGFHLNSLYSPYGWMSWVQVVDDFIRKKNDENQFKAFVNTTLGETYAERGESPGYMNIYNRREDYRIGEVPYDVCFLTAGVDVQKDRLEVEVVGWCSDKRSYSIDYRVLEGDTASLSVWNSLSLLLNSHFPRSNSGIEMPIRMMCIDSGYNTTHVYDFCRRFTSDRVVPIKGQDSLAMAVAAPKTVDVTRSGKRIGKVRLWNVGSSFLKSELYAWLRLEKEKGTPPPCYCHFPEYDETYFKGLTAEERVKKIVRGYPRYVWQKKETDRNEPLDCRVYARAAAAIVGLDRLRPEAIKAMSGRKTRSAPHLQFQTESVPPAVVVPASNNMQRRRRVSEYWD